MYSKKAMNTFTVGYLEHMKGYITDVKTEIETEGGIATVDEVIEKIDNQIKQFNLIEKIEEHVKN